MIDQSRVADGILFPTHSARASYLGTLTRNRPRWLKENRGWRRLVDIPGDDSSPPPPPAPAIVPRLTKTPPQVSLAESEITIRTRRYASARRVASMFNVSPRTLSRWDAAGIGPPKIKVGKKVLYDLDKIPEWLASRET